MSTSMSGGNTGFLSLDDDIVLGLPGKRLLNLAILLRPRPRA